MAKVTIVNEPKFKLELTEAEAKFLLCLTQNSPVYQDSEDEPEDLRRCRNAIFHALKGVIV